MTTEPLHPLFVRVDANAAIGLGHFSRCMALAQEWIDRGGRVAFGIRPEIPGLLDRLRQGGIEAYEIPVLDASDDALLTAETARRRGARWIVVDGYHFTSDYYRHAHDAGLRLLRMDDHATACSQLADVVVDQNPGADAAMYPAMSSVDLLLGEKYILLRREMRRGAAHRHERAHESRRVLVALGGGTVGPGALDVLQSLDALDRDGLDVTLLEGFTTEAEHSGIHEILRGLRLRVDVVRAVSDPTPLLEWADIAVVVAGVTLWEAMFTGCAVLSFSRNALQMSVLEYLRRRDAVCDVGDFLTPQRDVFERELARVLDSDELRRTLSRNATSLVDGRGAERVAHMLEERSVAEVSEWT